MINNKFTKPILILITILLAQVTPASAMMPVSRSVMRKIIDATNKQHSRSIIFPFLGVTFGAVGLYIAHASYVNYEKKKVQDAVRAFQDFCLDQESRG